MTPKKFHTIEMMSNKTKAYEQCLYFAATLADASKSNTPIAIMSSSSVARFSRNMDGEEDNNATHLYGLAPGSTFNTKYNGHLVTMKHEKIDTVVSSSSEEPTAMYSFVLKSKNKKTLEKFIDDAAIAFNKMFQSKSKYIRIFTTTKYGSWSPASLLPKRMTDTVILADELMSELLVDVQEYMDEEEAYLAHGIPYKRVYCLHGPPGTGKTSAIFAIASHFNLNIAMLSSFAENANVVDLVNNLPKKTCLVLEDVDTFMVRGKETSPKDSANMSTILNVLDGNLRKHGMIVFMTTNHLELLDPAVTRPGRVDVMKYVGYLSGQQSTRMYNQYYPKDNEGGIRIGDIVTRKGNVPPSEMNALIFTHRHSRDAFWTAVKEKYEVSKVAKVAKVDKVDKVAKVAK